jgi:steroid delta-isomerase-like uncharacterized protein
MSTMQIDRQKSLLLHYVQELWNQHNLSVIDEMILPDFVDHTLPAGFPQGPQGARGFAQVYLTAFPDTQIAFHEMIAEGDTVVLRWTATGTHTGDLVGIPPTGKKMQVQGLTLWRFQGEKFIESWNIFDQYLLLQQLGVIPAQAGAV